MSYRFLLLSSFLAPLIALGACSYAIDESIQDITLKTPGAHDAVCYVYVDGLRYRMRPPQTLNISKSGEDLEIDCLAPGNRRRKVYIEPAIEDSFYANAVTGMVPGGAWDFASKAMYAYPDVIEVSFVGIPTKPEDLPAQNNPDIKQPEEYDLEEFSPGDPRLNEDRNAPVVEVRRRERPGLQYTDTGGVDSGFIEEPAAGSSVVSGGKGDLMEIIDGLSTDINPSGEPSSPGAASDPVPLFPGE